MDCQCIVIGSLSSLMRPIATLLKNGDTVMIRSQLCKDSGHGAHSFNGIIALNKNDCIQLKHREVQHYHFPNCGHLAFIVLGS